MRRWIAVLAIIIVLAMGWRALSGRREASPPAPAVEGVPVEVAPAKTTTLISVVSAGGTVEAVHEVPVTAKILGRIAAVLVHEGDAVRAGQAVVRLESNELALQVQQAEANLRAAQARLSLVEQGARPQERAQIDAAVSQALANLEAAKANLARMQALYDTGAVSKAQLDAAQLQRDVAQSQYESVLQQRSVVQTGARPEELEMARAQVAQAQAAVSYARLQQANATITSPLAGIVTHRTADPGQMASPGVPLVTVAQIDKVYVALDLSEIDLNKIKIGQPVVLRADAYPGRTFSGVVREIGQAADAHTRVFKVKVQVDNRDRALRPGMFARGEITVGRTDQALVVPRDAVISADGTPVVFVVQDGKARQRRVTLGMMSGAEVEIRAGLAAGESVIVVGQSGLTDGTPVTVR